MSNENITDLRGHLFAALRGLTDTKNPMDVDRARAVSDVAQVIINSAKVEIEHMKITGNEKGCGFISATKDDGGGKKPAITDGHQPSIGTLIEQRPGVTVRRHTLK